MFSKIDNKMYINANIINNIFDDIYKDIQSLEMNVECTVSQVAHVPYLQPEVLCAQARAPQIVNWVANLKPKKQKRVNKPNKNKTNWTSKLPKSNIVEFYQQPAV